MINNKKNVEEQNWERQHKMNKHNTIVKNNKNFWCQILVVIELYRKTLNKIIF